MEFWIHSWGALTVLVCFVGIYLGLKRIMRFHGDNTVMSDRLVRVVFTDILIYGITAFFGLATLCGYEMDGLLYPARALFFLANVYFSYHLVKPF